MAKRETPEVNAGSMADIAFLLLIFFLVTTTIDKDKGMMRQLPPNDNDTEIDVRMRNILEININEKGALFVDDERVAKKDLVKIALAFIDNGGAPKGGDIEHCVYCQGERLTTSSDNPQKAIIAINTKRETSYEDYIFVQDKVTEAYNILRNRESLRLYAFEYTEIKRALTAGELKIDLKSTKNKLKKIRELYPMLITDAETKRSL